MKCESPVSEAASDFESAYLMKEIAAAHICLGMAQSSRDPMLVSTNLERALRVLETIDRHLPHSARGVRAVREARNDLRRRLERASARLKSVPALETSGADR